MSGFRGNLKYVKVEFEGDLIHITELDKLKPKEVANPNLRVGAFIRLDMDRLLVVDDDVWKLKFLGDVNMHYDHYVFANNKKLPKEAAQVILDMLKVEEK